MTNHRIVKRVIGVTLVSLLVVVLFWPMTPFDCEPYEVLGAWQAIERDGRLWLLVETELISPRSRLASPPYRRRSLRQYVFLIGQRGVQERHLLFPGLIKSFTTPFCHIVGTEKNLVLVQHDERKPTHLLIWTGSRFVAVAAKVRRELLDKLQLSEDDLTTDDDRTFDAACQRFGWKVVVRANGLVPCRSVECFTGLVRIATQKRNSHVDLVATGHGNRKWTTMLVHAGL